MFDQPVPVVGLEYRSQRFGNLLGLDQQIADGRDPQMEPGLESDLVGGLRENLQRARADVAQAHDPNVYIAHRPAS
jgi:hypothetical protein